MSPNQSIQHTSISGHHISYEPADKLQPGLVPHLIEIQGKPVSALLTIEHERQRKRDYHVVTYPSLKSIGYFNLAEIRVLGRITNYI